MTNEVMVVLGITPEMLEATGWHKCCACEHWYDQDEDAPHGCKAEKHQVTFTEQLQVA